MSEETKSRRGTNPKWHLATEKEAMDKIKERFPDGKLRPLDRVEGTQTIMSTYLLENKPANPLFPDQVDRLVIMVEINKPTSTQNSAWYTIYELRTLDTNLF
jgi:hypothetical protein